MGQLRGAEEAQVRPHPARHKEYGGTGGRGDAAGDSVEIRAYQSGGRIGIDVADTGTGIPPENLSRILDRYRLFRAGAEGGTGLGPPIARDIVEQNGGTIDVRSEEGRGSAFLAVFPAAEDKEGQRG